MRVSNVIKPKLVGSINPELAKSIVMQLNAEKLWLSYEIRVGQDGSGLLALPCASLCEKPLHRVHARCFTCGGREVYYGKRQQPIQVTAHVVYEPKALPVWRRKIAQICRSLHSLVTGI